jgi:hypothetical protein
MNNRKIYIVLAVVVILLVPYVLNAPWTISDYIIAGILLLSTGFIFETVTSRVNNPRKKIIAGMGVLLVAAYIWAELAVGIFTTLGS